MPRSIPRKPTPVVLVLCAILVAASLQLLSAGPAGAISAAANPYSDPIWFPVRDKVQIACVGNHDAANNDRTANGKCDHDHHGYFGMNIDSLGGVADNPVVYAAGAGIVEAVTSPLERACGGPSGSGNTIVVDHGGGVVSVYEHLKRFYVHVGDHVYPSTKIGLMGASGQPCHADGSPHNAYLDFQIRHEGGGYLTATTMNVRVLRGCTGSQTGSQVWPAGLNIGAKYWTDVAYKTHIDTSSTGACYPSAPAATPVLQPRPKIIAASHYARVNLPSVRGANRYMIQTEIFHTSTRSWGAPCSPYGSAHCTVGYTAAPGSFTHRAVTGLLVGRDYRMRLSVHNSRGWSRPSRWVFVKPAVPPAAPTFRRISASHHSVALSWLMPASDLHGATLTGFQVAIDFLLHRHWTRFSFAKVGPRAGEHYLWTGLKRHVTYRVLARATTTAGHGYWMKAHTARTN